MKRSHDAKDKPFDIIGSIKMYVDVAQLAVLVTFFVFERGAVQAILKCDFCDQFVECIYPKRHSLKLTNGSTFAVIRHYEKER